MIGNHPDYPNRPGARTPKYTCPLPRGSSNNMKAWSIIRKTTPKQDIPRPIPFQTIEHISPSSPRSNADTPTAIPLSQDARNYRLWTLPDERIRKSDHVSPLINETQFMNHSALVQYYSNNVFSQTFKFKRFTGILKKKFQPYPHTPQNQNYTEKREQPIPILSKTSNFQSPEWRCSKSKERDRECFDTLEPRLRLKRRPSSGIPMKKGEMVIKRRRNSLNECSRSCSIGITHIDALKCSQRTRSPRAKPKTPKTDKKPVVPQCILLRPMQLRGKQEGGIDPWEAEAEKVRMLTDLDISIKL